MSEHEQADKIVAKMTEEFKIERAAAEEVRRAEKEARAVERAEAKAAKEQLKAKAKAAKEAARSTMQNGVRRPGEGTAGGKVWALADAISNEIGSPAPVATVLERGIAQGLNAGNIRAEYASWKKYYGLSGRIAAPKAGEPAAA